MTNIYEVILAGTFVWKSCVSWIYRETGFKRELRISKLVVKKRKAQSRFLVRGSFSLVIKTVLSFTWFPIRISFRYERWNRTTSRPTPPLFHFTLSLLIPLVLSKCFPPFAIFFPLYHLFLHSPFSPSWRKSERDAKGVESFDLVAFLLFPLFAYNSVHAFQSSLLFTEKTSPLSLINEKPAF